MSPIEYFDTFLEKYQSICLGQGHVPTSPRPHLLSLPLQHLFIEESYNNNYLSSPLAYLHPSPLTATLELQGHRCFLICSHLENSILFSRKQALPSVAARLVSTSRLLDFSTILSFSFLVSISRLVSCLEIQDKMGFLWHKIVENYDFQKNLEKHFTI